MKYLLYLFATLSILLLSATLPAFGSAIEGSVVGISDGDTFTPDMLQPRVFCVGWKQWLDFSFSSQHMPLQTLCRLM